MHTLIAFVYMPEVLLGKGRHTTYVTCYLCIHAPLTTHSYHTLIHSYSFIVFNSYSLICCIADVRNDWGQIQLVLHTHCVLDWTFSTQGMRIPSNAFFLILLNCIVVLRQIVLCSELTHCLPTLKLTPLKLMQCCTV